MTTNKPKVQQYSPISYGERSAWMQEDDFGGWVRAVNYEVLQAECESLRKDAERYRWLRDGNNDENSEATRIAMHYYGGEWDEMIDVVMEEESK